MGLTVTTLALTCLTLLGAGYLVLALLGRNERLAPTVHEAWPILFTETLIVGVAVGVFWIGGWILTLALLIHAGRIGYEAAKVTELRARTLPPLVVGAAIAGIAFALSFLPMVLLCAPALIAAVVLILLGRRVGGSGGPDDQIQSVALDLALFPTLPLIVFTAAGLNGAYAVWLLAAFILVETFDSYALLGGKLFGKTKAFPRLSPNKTVQGLGVGAAMLMLTAALAGALLAGLPLIESGGIALFVGVLTVAGDLTASRLKRKSGVKDYPKILPHQGGLLDITDAWITAGAGLVCLVVLAGLG
ncbi:MAG: phosphatidate cytidylyltransferase [Rhodobacter sp.]|nr:phosphatidate cytidylyltransferase [Rhodobacter sp.]